MPHLSGPSFITLHVRDVEASRRFYAEVLGFPPSPEVRPNAAAFSTQPVPLAIRKAQIDLDAMPQPGYGIILWLKADDSAAVYKHLKERGVTITQELADGPFGKTFTFRDPDGYLLSVYDGG